MKKNLSAAILEKYFKGECNEIEIAEIYLWYDSFDSLSDDISNLSENEQELFKQLMLNNIRDNIEYAENDKVHRLDKTKSTRTKIFYWVSGIAAMVFIGLLIHYKSNNNFSLTKVVLQQASTNKVEITNITNTIKKITLSDGSKIWLSPNSKLTYPNFFGAHSRLVSMTGEAFFEVTKDAERPFSIYSDNVVTKVWGTSFRIRAYKNEVTKVSVVTGKVSVSVVAPAKSASSGLENVNATVKQQLMLTPDQEATYNKKLNSLKKKQEITDPSISIWKSASISFDNTPMPEVFRILSKKFKVSISSTDSKINSDYLNADFTDESLPSIMEIIKKSLNVNYVVKDNQFILESN